MDLTSGQRKALFALVVVALAALGVYMFVSAAHGAAAGSRPPARPHPRAARARPTATPAASRPAGSPTGPAAGGAAPNIYQWLPFDQAELASAASVATRFSAAYGTYSYTENATAYANSMSSLIAPGLSQVLAGSYSVPGVAAQRTTQKQVSTATAVINSLRAFGPSSLTFVVTITQEITETRGRDQVTGQYAVTVAGSGGSWQVNDIELASAGNS